MATVLSAKKVPDVATIRDNVSGVTYHFPFNINSLEWSYQLNTQSYSTIGGRVTQLLSVKINTMNVQGEAGTRANLMQMYANYKTMQTNQNQTKNPMTFSVPSKGLSWNVWLENFQMSWGVTTVSYPYVIYFEVDQDLNGAATNASTADALNKVVNNNQGNIGFSGVWTGLSSSVQNIQYSSLEAAIQSGALNQVSGGSTTTASGS